MNAAILSKAANYISEEMTKNRTYLVELDQKNGDGDLGVSMSNGYCAFADAIAANSDETDLGKLIMKGASAFNEAAPSSMGTITSVVMTGMAHSLKGKKDCALVDLVRSFRTGAEKAMERTGSKLGEKTFFDAYCPAIDALEANLDKNPIAAFGAAANAATAGAEATRQMVSVHGRAAYFADKSIGIIDGGAEVIRILFEAICSFVAQG